MGAMREPGVYQIKQTIERGWLFEDATADLLLASDAGPFVRMPDGRKMQLTWERWGWMLGNE